MSKKKFKPQDWATNNITEKNTVSTPVIPQSNIDTSNEIETITQRIEAASIDIAPNYADWRDLGFALADALGESGRNYYHRLSRFYPSYSQSETDKQYSACLASHGHGVTIKTLYHLTKSAGVSVSIPQPTKSPSLGGIGEANRLNNETTRFNPKTILTRNRRKRTRSRWRKQFGAERGYRIGIDRNAGESYYRQKKLC